jgi:hypothetical protein
MRMFMTFTSRYAMNRHLLFQSTGASYQYRKGSRFVTGSTCRVGLIRHADSTHSQARATRDSEEPAYHDRGIAIVARSGT